MSLLVEMFLFCLFLVEVCLGVHLVVCCLGDVVLHVCVLFCGSVLGVSLGVPVVGMCVLEWYDWWS